MKEYDVYLPLFYNHGRAIEDTKVNKVKRRLVEKFGGLTHFPQRNEGLWKFGGTTFRDQVSILRVLAEEPDGAPEFFSKLRRQMQHDLEQTSVLIVEREVKIVPA
jgi:hypothetical protein